MRVLAGDVDSFAVSGLHWSNGLIMPRNADLTAMTYETQSRFFFCETQDPLALRGKV
jgi:hypothetical protein